MRFVVGQAFESVMDGRQVVVAGVRDEGRAGLLRFLYYGHEQWALWAQFLNSDWDERGRQLRRPLCLHHDQVFACRPGPPRLTHSTTLWSKNGTSN
jgi:hypothetical protein